MKKAVFLPHMWQRLFFAILFLVVLAQVMPLALVFMKMPTIEEQRKKQVEFISSALAANLDGRNLADAGMYMDYFNKAGPELWFEQAGHHILAGIPVPGFTARERSRLRPVPSPRAGTKVWHGRGTWNYQPELPLDLLAVPVNFKDAGPATMFIIYPNYRLPRLYDDFYKALAILVLAGALVSYAVSRHLSAPLRQLQTQVMAIDEKSLDRPISISGTREVAAVARAVNHLTAELGRHSRNMTELVANISHELRSPLARMSGYAGFIEDGFDSASHQVELLQEKIADLIRNQNQPRKQGQKQLQEQPRKRGQFQQESGLPGSDAADLALDSDSRDLRAIHLGLRHLTLLKEELDHMDNLVGTTLLSSRLNLNRTLPPFHPVDLTRLCRDILRKRRLFLGNRGVELSWQMSENTIISGDKTLITQMVSNLVDNAAKYVSDRGSIHIGLVPQQGFVRFTIENTHPPFSDEELVRLFEPFFRAGRATGTGVGLGLALVKRIADIHRAEVRARNTCDGLCFELVFPVAGNPVTAGLGPAQASAQGV